MSRGNSTGGAERPDYGRYLPLFVLLVCVVLYLPGLGGPLFFDDIPNLAENAYLRLDANRFDNWRVAALSNDSGVLHRPLAMASFSFNALLAGELSPLQLKATNLLIHLATGLLLYHLFVALLATPALVGQRHDRSTARAVAFLAAVIWLLHPLHVSTVLYVVQRMAQLSTLFSIAGLLVFCRYRLRWAQMGAAPGEIGAAALWLALIGCAALLSKENGALLPWLVVVVEVFLFRGMWAGRENTALRRTGWVLLAVPLLLLALLFALDPGVLAERYARREFTLFERILTQARMLWHYVYWILVPNITAMSFHHDDIALSRSLWTPITTALASGAWIVCGIAALVYRRRFPLVSFAFVFFLVGHSIESSVWPLELAYEHRNYLPSTVICLVLAAGIFSLGRYIDWWRPVVAGGLFSLALCVLLGLRSLAWSSEMNLALHNVVNHPDSPRANFHYGRVLFMEMKRGWDNEFDENQRRAYAVTARSHFLRMHELSPGDMAATVMLLQMDAKFFPGLPNAPDWFSEVEIQAQGRPLQASDRTALNALVAFVTSPTAPEKERQWALGLVEKLSERYPFDAVFYARRFELLGALEADRDELIALLEKGLEANPRDPTLYPYLLGLYGNTRPADGYEVIGRGLRHDPLHRQLPMALRVFEQ